MKLSPLDLRGIDFTQGLPIPKIFSATTRVLFLTYTLTANSIEELNLISSRGVKVSGCCGKLMSGCKPKFPLRHDEKCHAKVWIVDHRVFVGSSNLSGDTIFNIMFEVKDKRSTQLIELVEHICNGDVFESKTLVL